MTTNECPTCIATAHAQNAADELPGTDCFDWHVEDWEFED